MKWAIIWSDVLDTNGLAGGIYIIVNPKLIHVRMTIKLASDNVGVPVGEDTMMVTTCGYGSLRQASRCTTIFKSELLNSPVNQISTITKIKIE